MSCNDGEHNFIVNMLANIFTWKNAFENDENDCQNGILPAMFQQVLQAKLWTSPRVLGDPACNEWLLILFHQPSTMAKKIESQMHNQAQAPS